MKVTIVLNFDRFTAETPSALGFAQEICDSLETIGTAFDADSCFIQEVNFETEAAE